MRPFLVDTLATIVFFTVAAAISELIVAGLDPMQVLVARAIMIPVMVATGRPYGLWRDLAFRRLAPRRLAGRIAADIGAFVSFQIPVYVATLAAAGATPREMLAAAATAVLFMLVLSRPFGLFLEAWRGWAGVRPG